MGEKGGKSTRKRVEGTEIRERMKRRGGMERREKGEGIGRKEGRVVMGVGDARG